MKKIISLILLASFLAMTVSATTIKIVKTTYEENLLESIDVKDYSKVIDDGWYFSKDGIDKTATKMVENLPDSEPVILYGISLGGTVARRMTQIANEEGKNVKGYIAQSSPLSGDRLTNTAWASTSLALMGGYALLGINNLFWGLPLENIFNREITNQEDDFLSVLDEKSRFIVNQCENTRNNKEFNRSNEQSIIENGTLPLLDLIFGSNENGREMSDYFSAVFSKGNNVKDLDPTGDFMVNVMNTNSAMQKEANDSIKRAFIVSTNGNIFETSAWTTVEPVLSYYQNQRDSYWAKAKQQWWLFAYWSLRAAASSVSVATIEGLPRAWSTCVSGSVDYSTNDGFVPANDTFWGKKLQMTAPNMRSNTYDRTYRCNKVSHIDYGVDFSKLQDEMGRSYPRKESVKQQQNSLYDACNFMGIIK